MPKKDDTSGGKAPVMEHGSGLSDDANFLKYKKKLGTYLIKERGPASYLTKKPCSPTKREQEQGSKGFTFGSL